MKTKMNLRHTTVMPISKKLLEGVTQTCTYELGEKLKLAVEAGATAQRDGKELADCPEMYRPKPGDASFYDAYVMGYKGTALADGGGAD